MAYSPLVLIHFRITLLHLDALLQVIDRICSIFLFVRRSILASFSHSSSTREQIAGSKISVATIDASIFSLSAGKVTSFSVNQNSTYRKGIYSHR